MGRAYLKSVVASPLTFDDIIASVKKLQPKMYKRYTIRACKKHYAKLILAFKKSNKGTTEYIAPAGYIGNLFGIPVVIRPYLKKIYLIRKP